MRVKANEKLFNELRDVESEFNTRGIASIVQNDADVSARDMVEFYEACDEIIKEKADELKRLRLSLTELKSKVSRHVMECEAGLDH